jgi:hypothetical protein
MVESIEFEKGSIHLANTPAGMAILPEWPKSGNGASRGDLLAD